jgi:protein-S-isoprenylcysteine O-methyltransferase Ste14
MSTVRPDILRNMSTVAAEPARPDHPIPGRSRALGDPGDIAARVVLGGLFLAFTARIWSDFLQTGRLTGLLLLASELLVVVLTIARRPAVTVNRTWDARAITILSALGSPLLDPGGMVAGAVPDSWTAPFSACGLLVVVLAKMSLGRSFGFMPAHRGLVCAGPYRLVRHPIYLGYLITHVAFLASHPTPWNAAVLIIADAALIVRTGYEERTLGGDPQYLSYQSRVRWRLMPGVY